MVRRLAQYHEGMSETIDWSPVDEALAEKSSSGVKLAMLEAGKILDERLDDVKIPGRTLREKVGSATLHLTNVKDVAKAADYLSGLRSGTTGALNRPQAERHIQSIRQAVTDLNELSAERQSPLAQAKLYAGALKGKQRWLKQALAGVGVVFLIILFLADTGWGRSLVGGVVGGVNTFFSWIITVLILIGLLILVVLGTAIYLDRRSGGRVSSDDE